MAKQEKVNIGLDYDESQKVCRMLLETFDESPIEDYRNIVHGITMALLVIIQRGKEETERKDDDCIEKEVLNVLKKMSEGDKYLINFHKYINL